MAPKKRDKQMEQQQKDDKFWRSLEVELQREQRPTKQGKARACKAPYSHGKMFPMRVWCFACSCFPFQGKPPRPPRAAPAPARPAQRPTKQGKMSEKKKKKEAEKEKERRFWAGLDEEISVQQRQLPTQASATALLQAAAIAQREAAAALKKAEEIKSEAAEEKAQALRFQQQAVEWAQREKNVIRDEAVAWSHRWRTDQEEEQKKKREEFEEEEKKKRVELEKELKEERRIREDAEALLHDEAWKEALLMEAAEGEEGEEGEEGQAKKRKKRRKCRGSGRGAASSSSGWV